MSAISQNQTLKFFDTTLRDGELTPGIKICLEDKLSLAAVLDEMGIDVIEVGYPGHFAKDFQEIIEVSKIVKNSIVCGLAGSHEKEILSVAEALKQTPRSRINIYTPVNLSHQLQHSGAEVLGVIENSVALARNYCDDIQWSAFDATRSNLDFLCRAIEAAIKAGAKTISIPDSMGLASPAEFSQLLSDIFNQVYHLDRVTVSVHCHNDLGQAVENSLVGINTGIRQIEGAIDGLGARKGNANLEVVVQEILARRDNRVALKTELFATATQLVSQFYSESRCLVCLGTPS